MGLTPARRSLSGSPRQFINFGALRYGFRGRHTNAGSLQNQGGGHSATRHNNLLASAEDASSVILQTHYC